MHLPTPEGWKAELAWVAGYITKINVRHRELDSDTVTYLSTNRARRRLTSLIETTALPRYVRPLSIHDDLSARSRYPLTVSDSQQSDFLSLTDCPRTTRNERTRR